MCLSPACPAHVPKVLWASRPLPTWRTELGTSSWCGRATHWAFSNSSTDTPAHRTRYGPKPRHISNGGGLSKTPVDTVGHLFFFLLYFQFDFPFVEVHRVKAVRFSLPPGKEDDGYEGICGTNVGPDDGQAGNVEAVSRNGSRQHLSEDGAGQDAAKGQKARSAFLCGLCCSKAPEVSVWNCDGEILSVTEIMCRYKSFFFCHPCNAFFFFFFATS